MRERERERERKMGERGREREILLVIYCANAEIDKQDKYRHTLIVTVG